MRYTQDHAWIAMKAPPGFEWAVDTSDGFNPDHAKDASETTRRLIMVAVEPGKEQRILYVDPSSGEIARFNETELQRRAFNSRDAVRSDTNESIQDNNQKIGDDLRRKSEGGDFGKEVDKETGKVKNPGPEPIIVTPPADIQF